MVDVGFEPNEDSVTCQGCGAEIPAFLDGCPYCDDDSEDVDTQPCPSCGAEIYAASEQCSICGAWVTMKSGSRPAQRIRQLWITIFILVVIVAVLMFF